MPAAHAMETPLRLLHSRTERTPAGVANRPDQVGRNLMNHRIQLSWALAGEPVCLWPRPAFHPGNREHPDSVFRRDRSAPGIEIGINGWTWPTGGAMTLADTLTRQGQRGMPLREAARHVRLASLRVQLSEEENRITLDARDRDGFGVPLPRLCYRVGACSRTGIAAWRGRPTKRSLRD